MWINLIQKLPWRGLLLAMIISGFLAGLYYMGYGNGRDNAKRDGDTAISKLQSEFDRYRREQAEQDNAALKAWAARYQEQVAAGHQAEAGYLEQIAQLESRNRQLQRQVKDVTQRWIDEKGTSHSIECVFTRGFVQQYNAALGYNDTSGSTGIPDTAATAGTGAGTTSRQPETTDTRLRDSGVSQRDVLANIIDNAQQCRTWQSQINGLLDEREGLQK
ncbi:hypothetical protein CYG68_20285 [Morganella morganii]|uniref:Uncharacterized protein n=2 Tax=Morganella morganii TaxID=582 RepID=A0A8I0U8T3_MORMO|nr:hypothetical protein [Morganella morganii]